MRPLFFSRMAVVFCGKLQCSTDFCDFIYHRDDVSMVDRRHAVQVCDDLAFFQIQIRLIVLVQRFYTNTRPTIF
jgi:hypothetical protein